MGEKMHDMILALFFISLLVSPAVIAAITGKESSEPKTVPMREAKPKAAAVRSAAKKTVGLSYAATLPLHGTRALSGR